MVRPPVVACEHAPAAAAAAAAPPAKAVRWSLASDAAPQHADQVSEPLAVPGAGPAAADGAAVPSCVRAGLASDRGRRARNEDVMLAAEEEAWHLFALFDGHCGAGAAEFASQQLVPGLRSCAAFPADPGTALVQTFLALDQAYHSTGGSAGTTALAAIVHGSSVVIANAGDSRAVLSRRGRAIELTRDHKPCAPAERERIQLAGGYVCPEGMLCGELAVARAIGDFHLPQLKQHGAPCPLTAEPEVTCHALQPEDEFLLLACDGVWDVLSSQRAAEFARSRLREHNDPQRCAEELVAEALQRHSADNCSAICVCFSQEPPVRRVYGGRVSRSVSREGLSTLSTLLAEAAAP